MSDVNLLVFGCVVTMVVFSAVYIYIRGDFAREQPPTELEQLSTELPKAKIGA